MRVTNTRIHVHAVVVKLLLSILAEDRGIGKIQKDSYPSRMFPYFSIPRIQAKIDSYILIMHVLRI